jgi:hypothetical protein
MVLTENKIKNEASKHCRNKRGDYLKDKINEIETKSRTKNIKDID